MHYEANSSPVNGVKAILHTPDGDRVLPIVPEGTKAREDGRQKEKGKEGAVDS